MLNILIKFSLLYIFRININKISKENKELKDEIEIEEKQITFENTE